jgi:signal transduction histidine kinase
MVKSPSAGQCCRMALPQHAQPASVASAAVSWLPRSGRLTFGEWQWRHRLVCRVLAVHLPALAIIAMATDQPSAVLPVVGVLGLLLGLASLGLGRQVRTAAAALGLLSASALLVHLLDGSTESHFHFFVAVTVLALYQQWTVYALAIGFVFLQHGLLERMGAAHAGSLGHWWLALVEAAFVLAQSAVLILFWRANEVSRSQHEKLQAELSAGRSTVEARLAETERMRADLIGTVSHEFRTPLTGIRGAALTLLKRGERLDPASRTALLHAVLDQQERLSRLLENMLIAARATAVDPSAVTDVDAVAAEVAMLASAGRPGAGPVSVVVEPGTSARIDRQALHQVLANLVDNALQHGAAGALPLVAGGRDDRGIWVTVSNEGRVLDLSAAARLFEPFTQLDGGATRDREGIGVGLYVVRRLVEVYGGSVDVRSDSGWVTVEVRLEPGDAAARPAPLASSPV